LSFVCRRKNYFVLVFEIFLSSWLLEQKLILKVKYWDGC
jgi:hypothetical protein